MSITVCLNANTLTYPTGGGHRWVYLNWALGLRDAGCRVIWLEGASNDWPVEQTRRFLATSLEQWLPTPPNPDAPFTTVTQWQSGDWLVHGEESYPNTKGDGFLPFLDVPLATRQPLELAVNLGQWSGDDREMLLAKGWRLAD